MNNSLQLKEFRSQNKRFQGYYITSKKIKIPK